MTIPEIAKREALSPSHVAKLMGALRRAGIVASVRGQAGGYQLTAAAKDTMVGDVLAALGGRIFSEGFCERHGGPGDCVHDSDCRLRPLWAELQVAVDQVVGRVSLADLASPVARANVKWMGERPPTSAARG